MEVLQTPPNPGHTNLRERSADVSKSYHKYHVPVECSDCGEEWLKYKGSIPKWEGRCRSCAGKLTGHLSAPAKVNCVRCGQQTATAKTNPCADCNRQALSSTCYYHKNRVEVTCSDCNVTWQKSECTLKEWKGRCRSCALKVRVNDPVYKAALSERSRQQVLRQGGIPNAVKITRERVTGENNPRWRGGITPHIMRVRCSPEYKQWRFDVFARDNFTCVMCGKADSGHLHADHYPKPFSRIFNEFLSLGIEAKDHAEFWDTSNGRTLCATCHNKYGWRPSREAVAHS